MMPWIYFVTILVLMAIFIMPNPFVGITFPFADGIRLFDGYTRVNFTTDEDSAIDDVNLILWPGEREAFQILLTRTGGLGEVMLNCFLEMEPSPSPEYEQGWENGIRDPLYSTPQVKLFF